MSVQSFTGSYPVYRKPGYTTKWTAQRSALSGGVSQTGYTSMYNNTCTDSADDGQISFWDKVKGVGKGAIRSVTNIAKGIIKNPLKSAAIVGVCCIPVVGKFIGLGLAAYGLVKSGAQLVQNAKEAGQATTDAQAKDAWENIGTSGFNAALSAVAIKGCVSGIKYDLNGGSSTVNLARQLKADGVAKSELYSSVAKSAVRETGSNVAAIPKAIYNKAKSAGTKAVDFYKSNKGETFGETVGNMFKAAKDIAVDKYNSTIDKIADKAASKAEKIGKKLDERTAKAEEAKAKAEAEKNMTPEEKAAAKETAKAEAEAQKAAAKAEAEAKKAASQAEAEAAKTNVENIKTSAKAEGATVRERFGGNFEVKAKSGEVTCYNAKGVRTKVLETNGNITYYGADGNTVIRELHYFDNGEIGIYDTTKGFISPAEANGYNQNVQLGFGKLTRTAPITNQTAAELTPYIKIGEDELK